MSTTTTRKTQSIERKLIGRVAVDSGTVMILDPCQIGHGIPDLYESMDDFRSECYDKTHRNADCAGQLINRNRVSLAVVSSTGTGDGYFPVYALYEHGHFCGLEIDTRRYCKNCSKWIPADRHNFVFCDVDCQMEYDRDNKE